MGSWGREDTWQGGGWRTGQARQWQVVPHSRLDNQEEQLGSETDCANQGSSVGKESLKSGTRAEQAALFPL